MPGIHFSCRAPINSAKANLICNLSPCSWDASLCCCSTQSVVLSYTPACEWSTHQGCFIRRRHACPQEIPRVLKGNSCWTLASDVNAATALPSPRGSPAFKFKCSLLALGEQIYWISSALFLPPRVTLPPSPSAYCFYSPTFVSAVLNFTL